MHVLLNGLFAITLSDFFQFEKLFCSEDRGKRKVSFQESVDEVGRIVSKYPKTLSWSGALFPYIKELLLGSSNSESQEFLTVIHVTAIPTCIILWQSLPLFSVSPSFPPSLLLFL